MAQKDWNEVLKIFSNKDSGYMKKFIASEQLFAPNESLLNPFSPDSINFSAQDLSKPKPGNWIPIYKQQDIPLFFHENTIVPIRSGPAEFFFYRGEIFFDLSKQHFSLVDVNSIESIDCFIPSTLTAKFQRNENAYLNKAVALGYMNHFLEEQNFQVLKRELINKSGKRFLYGQFGKIKTTKEFAFQTSKGQKNIHKGFQFEIDLVLENQDEIIIFEAKSSSKPTQSFSLLQLYYPLIYFKSILNESKKIRTVFIDITTDDKTETYRLLEIDFKDTYIDQWSVIKHAMYVNQK